VAVAVAVAAAALGGGVVPAIVGGPASAGSVAGQAGTDTSLPATDSAVTVSGSGPFANLRVTVNQTKNLVDQAISVTWTGGAPTYTDPVSRSFASQFTGDYLQMFECWGDPQSVNPPDAGPGPQPTQCEVGAESPTPTSAYPIPEVGHEYSRVLSQPGWGDYASLAGAPIPGTSLTTWVDHSSDGTGYAVEPFQAVDGTVINQQADYNYNSNPFSPQPFWLNSEFSYGTTNEVDFARTFADGTGQQIFQADTGQTASGLGCGQSVQKLAGGGTKVPQCWLVVVPRSTGQAEDPTGALTATQSVVTSPLTPEAWAHRIAVPLSFNPVGTTCSPTAPTDEIFGSELASTAFQSWEPGLCQGGSTSNYQFVSSNDTLARRNLTEPQYGSAGMSVFSDPVDATATPSSPVVYSPLTLSGVVVAFNVDRVAGLDAQSQPYPDEEALAGSRVEHLFLTPRLMAKLLTESYQAELQDVTTDKAPAYAWIQKNPVSLFTDPDFLQYNPEFTELTTQQKVDASTLVVEETSSDSALAVWKWILADRAAREWLSGVPDQWGMGVNPYYSLNADQNPNGEAFDNPVPSTFPKSDPYCYDTGQEVYGVAGQPAQPARPLCVQDWSPYTLGMAAAALAAATANDGAKTTLDPTQSANTAWTSNGPQESGNDCVLVVTDTASAARYGLQTASLSHAGDDASPTFVAPTSASILAGEHAMTPSTVAGVVVPNPSITTAGAYPLPMVTYGATTPATLTAGQRSDYAAMVRFVATSGQVPGDRPGNLPPGYVPLPADLAQEATASAASILNPPATPAPATAPAAPPTPVPSFGGDQVTASTTAATVLASLNPLAGGPGSTSGRHPTDQLALERTGLVPIGAIRWILPIVLLVALIAAASAVMVGRRAGRPRRRRRGRGTGGVRTGGDLAMTRSSRPGVHPFAPRPPIPPPPGDRGRPVDTRHRTHRGESPMTNESIRRARRRRGGLRPTTATVLGLGGAACLLVAVPVSLASAATVNGQATITTPGTTTALDSGGSTTQFTVDLPANAACSGDTASGGYHVYSYLVPSGTSVTGVTFVNFPSTGLGFVDTSGNYYGPANTAVTTGQIVNIPNNLEFAPLLSFSGVTVASLTGGSNHGVWDGGIVCADTTGHVSDFWTTEITFVASAGDPNGFTWTANSSTTTTTTTTAGGSTTTTTGGGSTTTTSADGATTTTSPVSLSNGGSGTGSGSTGTGTGDPGSTGALSGGSGATGGTGTGTSGSNLASTGAPVQRLTGYGLLVLGIGLLLLGWRARHRRRATPGAPSPW
jgi:hypothetical protein